MLMAVILTGCFGGSKVPRTYSVAGQVTDGGRSVAGVTIHFSDGSETVETNENGFWSKDGLAGPVTITPDKEGYYFFPRSHNVLRASTPLDFQVVQNHEYPEIDWSGNSLLKIEAQPHLGFNYDYFLFIPQNSIHNQGAHMLVEPNNTGNVSDRIEDHEIRTRELVEYGIPRAIAERLNIPLLIPVFPRPETIPPGAIYHAYTHALCRNTLMTTDEKLKRVDLQLIAMIDHAQGLLLENGFAVDYKVFMNGFSATGNYLTRFPLIHPERIRALAAGGLNGIPTLPVKEWEGKTLRYPVGIADLYELTGVEFNIDEYRQIAQYLYMGSDDFNDTLPYKDAYAPEDAALVRKLLGDTIMQRWENSINIYHSAGIKAQMVTYDGVGHTILPEMLNDIVSFFRANEGSGITKIVPYEYDAEPSEQPKFEGADIVGLVWLDDESVSEFIRDALQDYGEFAIIIADTNHHEFQTFILEVTRNFVLKSEGYPDLQVELHGQYASHGIPDMNVHYSMRIKNPKSMVAGVSYTLVPVYENGEPHRWNLLNNELRGKKL